MSLLYPAYLWVAALAAVAVIGLHCIAHVQPKPQAFPTARFVPQAPLHATVRSLHLNDVWLLVLRVLALLLLGLGLAQPHWVLPGSIARVVMVDGSTSVARTPDWQQKVAQLVDGADAVVVYASQAHVLQPETVQDFLQNQQDMTPVGHLSPALLQALRTGAELRQRASAVDIQIVAPFFTASFDAATLAIRQQWPYALQLTQVGAEPLAQIAGAAHSVQIHWPEESGNRFWRRRAQVQTVNAVYSDIATLIAPFERRWEVAGGDGDATSQITPIAWWMDGEPAAVEQVVDGVRHSWMGFAMPSEGDAQFRPAFVRFEAWLQSPQRLPWGMVPVAADELAQFAKAAQGLDGDAGRPKMDRPAPWVWALLLASVIMLLLEWFARRWLVRHAPVRAQAGGAT